MSSPSTYPNSIPSTPRPLTRNSVLEAYTLIKPYIHLTPFLPSKTLSHLCSTPRPTIPESSPSPPTPTTLPPPRLKIFLKQEPLQKIGAFKYRGAMHSLLHLLGETSSLPDPLPNRQTLKKAGVITHSSGNHAQALARAARELGVPATVVMPEISVPVKVAATRAYGARVVFSGSTAVERESVVRDLMEDAQRDGNGGVDGEGGMVLVPPYDAVDVILGQGTMGVEMQMQFAEMDDGGGKGGKGGKLDAVIAPVGGGGMLAGLALAFQGTGTRVFGAEPSFQGADDCKRGLEADPPYRVERVSSLTVADGVRTPVGKIPWSVISQGDLVRGVYSVSEEEICSAMRIVWERVKVVVEPTAALGVAVALFDGEFRDMCRREMDREGKESWNLGIVVSGGNVDLSAAGELLARGVSKVEVDGDGENEPNVGHVAG